MLLSSMRVSAALGSPIASICTLSPKTLLQSVLKKTQDAGIVVYEQNGGLLVNRFHILDRAKLSDLTNRYIRSKNRRRGGEIPLRDAVLTGK